MEKRAAHVIGTVLAASLSTLLIGGCGGFLRSAATPTPPSVTPLPTLDAEAMVQGRQVYAEHCASCHGIEGEGEPNWKEPLPSGNYPAPPHDDGGHTWHHGDGTLYRVVSDGSMPRREGLPPGMPAFDDRLTDEEVRATIQYVKTFWSEENRRFQWEQSQRDPFPVQ